MTYGLYIGIYVLVSGMCVWVHHFNDTKEHFGPIILDVESVCNLEVPQTALYIDGQ